MPRILQIRQKLLTDIEKIRTVALVAHNKIAHQLLPCDHCRAVARWKATADKAFNILKDQITVNFQTAVFNALGPGLCSGSQ